MNKYLPPPAGLWHLGEQCGIDLYVDVVTGRFLEIDVTEDQNYRIGMFQGMLIADVETVRDSNRIPLSGNNGDT